MRKTTLKDIAHAAGVSAMAVSKAINNKPGLSAATRNRILGIAKDMNYIPNQSAKQLRCNTTKTLGVILSDSSEMVTAKVLRAIYDCASRNGYNIIVANTDHIVDRERSAVMTLVSKQIDGLIMVAPLLHHDEDIQFLRSFDVPFVFLMRKNDSMSIDTVINDNYLGGYHTVQHLLEEGCRRFLFLLLENSQIGLERKMGYMQILADMRIPPDAYRFIESSSFTEAAYQAVETALDDDDSIDALVCGCDTQAIGAMNAILHKGKRIPEDICLTGYDGIDLTEYLRVSLTTVVQPLYQLGYQGTEILLDRIKYGEMPVRKIVLKSELVVRESTNRRSKEELIFAPTEGKY